MSEKIMTEREQIIQMVKEAFGEFASDLPCQGLADSILVYIERRDEAIKKELIRLIKKGGE